MGGTEANRNGFGVRHAFAVGITPLSRMNSARSFSSSPMELVTALALACALARCAWRRESLRSIRLSSFASAACRMPALSSATERIGRGPPLRVLAVRAVRALVEVVFMREVYQPPQRASSPCPI